MAESSPVNKIAILGSNGYIGRNMSFYLHQLGYSVQDFDIQDQTDNAWMQYEKLDIREQKSLSKISADCNFIFLFSGITGTWNGFDNYQSFIEINEIGLLNVLNFMRLSDSKARIIFPSTRLVYKGIENTALAEDAKKEPRTIYAINKLAGEQLLQLYADIFNIKYTIYRLSVPYGNLVGKNYSYGTIGFFLKQATEKQEITLYGDGSLRRTFSNIEDICRLLCVSMNNPASVNETFNIGGENFSLREVAALISSHYKKSAIIYIPWEENSLKIESGDTVFDSAKIDSLCNFEYKNTFIKWLDKL